VFHLRVCICPGQDYNPPRLRARPLGPRTQERFRVPRRLLDFPRRDAEDDGR
jgi:hypothetical protein